MTRSIEMLSDRITVGHHNSNRVMTRRHQGSHRRFGSQVGLIAMESLKRAANIEGLQIPIENTRRIRTTRRYLSDQERNTLSNKQKFELTKARREEESSNRLLKAAFSPEVDTFVKVMTGAKNRARPKAMAKKLTQINEIAGLLRSLKHP